MKQIFILILSILTISTIIAQSNNKPNGFANFDEYQINEPGLSFNFQIKRRNGIDVFFVGGIYNYQVQNVMPKTDTDKLEKEIWGLIQGDSTYINSYPYSKIKGYNLILAKGYYSYFIGEPARTGNEQRALGIIKENEKQAPVCCQIPYVILPDGTVKHLRPELLLELCKDDEFTLSEIKSANLKLDSVSEMFDLLNKYNRSKE